MVKTFFCPLTEICDIYGNWSFQTEKKNLDVIYQDNNKKYYCLAKQAVEDSISKKGIFVSEKIIEKFKDIKSGCILLELENK